jgi:alpha-beta hydrolase superfamily lysophospholipase
MATFISLIREITVITLIIQGNSPHTDTHTIQDLTEDLYRYITDNQLLNPVNKLTLIGHSKGGMALM